MADRADRMMAPLIVGEYYLVPTIRYEWNNMVRHWPVMGPHHNDSDRFFFKEDHYHLDVRFIPKIMFRRGSPFSQPLHAHPSWRYDSRPLPAPVLRRMRCRRNLVDYPHHDRKEIQGIASDFAGQQCARGKGGWICPHRKFSLGSLQPVEGVVTCPLHGLRIEAATGRVLPAALTGKTP